MLSPFAALPVYLTCQLISSRNSTHRDTTLDILVSNETTVLPDGYTAFPDIGVAYKYYDRNLTWNLARKHCITEGGNLAILDSFEKSRHADVAILKMSATRGPYVGFHRLFDNSEWVSAKTGLPVIFIPWRDGTNFNESSLSCSAYWGANGVGIGPYACNRPWAHLCEIPISEKLKYEVQSYKTNEILQIQTGLDYTDYHNLIPN